jgi:hypothetical protein
MSAGEPGDNQAAQGQMQHRTPPVDGLNWLRHGVDTQPALIDEMLLAGTYTLQQMGAELNVHFPPAQALDSRIRRIRDHFGHLQERWNRGMAPHRLRLTKAPNGRWRFEGKGPGSGVARKASRLPARHHQALV